MELHFSQPQSLKEKRALLKSLVGRIKNVFNVSIAEIDGMDLWQASVLAVAAIGRETRRVNQILDHLIEFVRAEQGVEIMRQQMEFF